MPITQIIGLLFLLIALMMVIYTFLPNWPAQSTPVVNIARIVGLIIGLVVLYLVYVLVLAIVSHLPGV